MTALQTIAEGLGSFVPLLLVLGAMRAYARRVER